VAAGDFDFVLDANVVGQHDVCIRAVTKQANDGGMGAVQDSNDAALGALRASDASEPLNLHQDVVAVHGVLDGVPRDEHIPIELRDGDIGNNKAIAIVVKHQPPL